jgi:hypothetical protein
MALSKYARQVRADVIAALEGLGAPSDWLEELRKSEPPAVHSSFLFPQVFPWPAFHRFKGSVEEWGVRADAVYQRIRAEHMAVLRAWKPTDEAITGGPIAEQKRRRGPGKTDRIAPYEDRIKWAAEWLRGRTWEDIAGQYLHPESDPEMRKAADRVRLSATDILRTAGFDKSNRLPKNRR